MMATFDLRSIPEKEISCAITQSFQLTTLQTVDNPDLRSSAIQNITPGTGSDFVEKPKVSGPFFVAPPSTQQFQPVTERCRHDG